MSDKLLVLVPYRDREAHLAQFLPGIVSFLDNTGIETRILIVEQADDLMFNRGALLNAGFLLTDTFNSTHVCFHDVDCIPIVSDYSYYPHISLLWPREVEKNWYSPVITCPTNLFKKANGFSNEYWGWGSEDADFFLRTGNTFVLKTKTQYKELFHEPCYMLNGAVRPECVKNHQRLMSYSSNSEGLSTCNFAIADKLKLIDSNQNVQIFGVKVDLTCLQM